MLLFAGYGLVWESLRRFDGKPTVGRPLLWAVALFAVAFFGVVALGAKLHHRAALVGGALAVFAMLSAVELGRSRDGEQSRSRLAMSGVFVVMATMLAMRALLTLVQPDILADDYFDPLRGLVPMTNSIAVVCLSIGLLMMANERISSRHRKLALTDELTGLPNRRSFLERADRLAQRALRDGSPASILMMDLDHFSRINETFGHPGGDEALASFAALLLQSLRADDTVGRYGGEEFCALLLGVECRQAAAIADGIRKRLASRPIVIRGTPHPITVSIGVAPVVAADIEAALSRADEALYRAKAEGRNRVVAVAPDTTDDASPVPAPG